MEKWDETAVWQRVMAGAQEQPRDPLEGLLRETAELAEAYRSLATGKDREAFLALARGQREAAGYIRGVGKLRGEKLGPIRSIKPGKEPREKLLCRCYHRSRRLMAEYTARAATPETGLIFDHLAEKEREHCLKLAKLLGMAESAN